jgi:hypothetical protein
VTALAARPFSTTWVVLSVLVFCAAELVLGYFVGSVVVGKYVSPMFHLKVQVLLNLGAYFVGGVAIGVLSPGVRVVEPAVGAFVSVGLTLIISWFLPYAFLRLSFEKLLLGGGIAFVIALMGAKLGERLTGNLR